MSIIFPLEEQPIPFQLLSKGLEYKRYELTIRYMNDLQFSLGIKMFKTAKYVKTNLILKNIIKHFFTEFFLIPKKI